VEEGELAASPLRVKVTNLLDDLISDYKVRELSSLQTITCHIEGKEYGLRKLFGHMKPKAVAEKPVPLLPISAPHQKVRLLPFSANSGFPSSNGAPTISIWK
jgi:hypothetical protein